MVVSVSPDASVVGRDVLARGGNAIDAAVATAFALAVTFPEAGNLGGGGFMLIHFPDNHAPVVIDYRETAPAAASPDMFFKKEDRTAHRLVGVPGTVRGLALAHENRGKLPWRVLLLPAIRLAREGFPVNADLASSLNRVLAANADKQELQRIFGNHSWKPGDVLRQPDLAETLQLIADHGADAFYTGPIADSIVTEMQRGGGLITKADLANYRPQLRTPIHGQYRGCSIYAPPPPSSGGVALVEMLNILSHFDLAQHDRYSSQTLHLMTEAMRRAYADRAKFLGDNADPQSLLDTDHAARLAASIDPNKATASESLAAEITLRDEPQNTTHFSIIDAEGIAVSNTYTLEDSYGGKIVVPGAGFLLNNELGDFNPQPGVTTRTGQIGTTPNLPAPGKRPLSSMTPTIVTKDGKVVLVTGSPGGRTIINTVLCVLVNYIDYHMPPRQCIDSPRHHHQWFPDRIQAEQGVPREGLERLGHKFDPTARRQGDAHSIFYDPATGQWIGLADTRRAGAAAGY
jgi:gamma-glutamyltranspeptidase/glutathione hydrolase